MQDKYNFTSRNKVTYDTTLKPTNCVKGVVVVLPIWYNFLGLILEAWGYPHPTPPTDNSVSTLFLILSIILCHANQLSLNNSLVHQIVP